MDVLSTIFPSYLHMMNNRLGVTVQEECYLAVVIAATLAVSFQLDAGGNGLFDCPRACFPH